MCSKSYKKICKKCKWNNIKKDWFKRWRQRYKCKDCGHVFQNKKRKNNVNLEKLWLEYAIWKQTYKELAKKYKKTVPTIQKLLDSYEFKDKLIKPREIVLLIDTTYFWDFWIMAFKDYESKKIINYKIVSNENNTDYKDWIKELQEKWWKILAIVCDWRKWLLWGFWDIPTQMCNYHQLAIIRRYITKKPILEANKDLKKISLLLTQTDKETFEYELQKWYLKYQNFIKEKWINKKWKGYYIHKRTRSAYFSLKKNLQFLFIRYDYIWKINIPNTTNWLEWIFWHIKPKISIHRWLKKERKIKLILTLLTYQKN